MRPEDRVRPLRNVQVRPPSSVRPTIPPSTSKPPPAAAPPARKAPFAIPKLVPVKRRLADAGRRKADGLLITGDAAYLAPLQRALDFLTEEKYDFFMGQFYDSHNVPC